ncbi:hypothetical protein F4775DRAFT_595232 [Biscogniauxia sp. FL1348]|nr:hypothetical protein F4775DRAFT_595232 [Biscogniauxia sp. FL1348]
MTAIPIQAAARLRGPALPAFRQFIRSIEPPTSPRPSFGSQRADWGRIAKSRVQQAAIYIPGMSLVLGWPWIARSMLDGRV